MKIKQRKLKLKKAGAIFKIVGNELKKNEHTQIVIHEKILKELEQRNKKHKVSISDYSEVGDKVEKWYTLYEDKLSKSEEISQLGVRRISKDFYHVTKFRGFGFGFSYLEEYVYDEYKAKRILAIKLKKK